MKVYHDKFPSFGLNLGDSEFKTFPDDYELVAEVVAIDLNEAYFLTNSVNGYWWNNEKVTLFKESRSTSIGDVIVDKDQNYVVMPLGFQKIEQQVKRNLYG